MTLQALKMYKKYSDIESFIESWLGWDANLVFKVYGREVDEICSESEEDHACPTEIWDQRKKCECIQLQFNDLVVYVIKKPENKF